MLSRFSPRFGYFVLFLLCAGLLGFGFFLQTQEGIEPCPLCILQRYAFVLCAIVALIAALHNSHNVMRSIYGAVIALLALAGGSVSVYQVYLQHVPSAASACGPAGPVEKFVNALPFADWFPNIFYAGGDCAAVDWTFLGFSIAEWALVWFAFLILTGAWQMLRRWSKS